MLRINCVEEDIKKLHYQRYHHPHPLVQRKMEAIAIAKIVRTFSISPRRQTLDSELQFQSLYCPNSLGYCYIYLKSQGVKHKDIYKLCQISKTTLTKYIRQYQKGGIEELKKIEYIVIPNKIETDYFSHSLDLSC